MFDLIILILSIAIAVISVVWSILCVKKLFDLKKLFNSSTIVVPLYKKNRWTQFSIAFLCACLIADIVLMIVLKAYIVCVCIMVVILALIAVLFFMMTLKCAVLDSGVVIPYKYIDWAHLHDYCIEGNSIFFCGDKKGFDTLTSASSKLIFDEQNYDKLKLILDKYKLNK